MKSVTEARDLALAIVETVAETVAEPLLVLDTKMRIKTANQAFDFGILIWPSSAFCFGPPS